MPPSGNDQLTFLVDTNPFDATSKANKKRVRSIAALKSWPERRKRTFEQLEGSGDNTTFFLNPQEFATGPQSTTAESRTRRKSLVKTSDLQQTRRTTRGSKSASSPTVEKGGKSAANPNCTKKTTPDVSCQCATCEALYVIKNPRPIAKPRSRRQTDGSIPTISRDLALLTPPASPNNSPLQIIGGSGDPFGCYPVPKKPWFDGILHHMLTVFAPRAWPALRITREQGLNWEWFMTQHALAEPALFYVRLLFASGDLISLGVLKKEIQFWLRAQAIRAINEALADPKRATSDPLILAVGRIAFHESMYGDREAANAIHRPAQAHMIMMRGGMEALDFPDLVKRLMRWTDEVMSIQGGTRKFLEPATPDQRYTIAETVTILDKWMPKQGIVIRSKTSKTSPPPSEASEDNEGNFPSRDRPI
ncbi:Hypothetical protein R9X50_00722100 [Acrodontium crateriforme]|uniref:Uncharacterized protein n=1 Tax=Acrodontium crateriforme TaxID=150365 RepID=A0AAQ3M9D4_9PEZI|nr:Hypothetical protein R9X50_00722100 [Acrodontium crateriforme]